MPRAPITLSEVERANLRTVHCQAQFEAMDTLEELKQDERMALAAIEEAAGPPLLTNGRPTVARVVAWMAHEGVNRNRQYFIKEELEKAASKVSVTSPLVMDFNHEAIRQSDGEQRMVGVWHKAEYAFDPKALGGKGAWGLLVQGVFFSWLFPEIANRLLAEQGRAGVIDFSMACIAGSTELGNDDNGQYEILHNPVFFTNSALDVPPADKDAHGLAAEGATHPMIELELMEQLLGQGSSRPAAVALQERVAALVAAALRDREEVMPAAKPVVQYAHVIQDNAAVVTATLTYFVADDKQEIETAIYTIPLPAPEKIDTAAFETKIADLESALETAKSAGATLTTEFEAVKAENVAMTTRLAEIDAAAAEALKAAQLATRKAALPEVYLSKHDAKDEASRLEIEARWATKSDAEWTEFMEVLAEAAAPAGVSTASYLERSRREQIVVPAAGTAATAIADRVSAFTK
jgi:hypothetical protein